MSYATCVSGLMSILGDMWSPQQVSHGDESIFAKGNTPVAVIGLTPGLEHRRETFGGGHLHVWTLSVVVAARWVNDSDGPIALQDAWQEVLDQLCIHADLDDTPGVREIEVAGANLEPVHFEVGSAKFASVAVAVRVTEDVTVQEV